MLGAAVATGKKKAGKTAPGIIASNDSSSNLRVRQLLYSVLICLFLFLFLFIYFCSTMLYWQHCEEREEGAREKEREKGEQEICTAGRGRERERERERECQGER